jgi:chitin disaccharide deacetylase
MESFPRSELLSKIRLRSPAAVKRLIINADDFGITDGVTRGISEALSSGFVSTASVMTCVEGAVQRARSYASQFQARLGIHLQLTDGVPCSDEVPSLVLSNGRFPRAIRTPWNPNIDEIRKEWHAQVRRAMDAGIAISHIDTHHHVHRLPAVFGVYCEIASFYDLSARTLTPAYTSALRCVGIRCADLCDIGWYEHLSAAGLADRIETTIARSNLEVLELMCHPGYCDSELIQKSLYAEGRELQLRTLSDPELGTLLYRKGITLERRSLSTL